MRLLPKGSRWPLELGVLGGTIALWTGGEYVRVRRKPKLPVEQRAQRALNRLDREVRALLLRPQFAATADRLSDFLAYIGLPVSGALALSLGSKRWKEHIVADALVITRAVTVTGALNQVVKFLAPRERPYVHSGRFDHRDLNGSFFSNHTSSSMALAASAMRISFERSRNSYMVAAPLFLLAGLVGYLRIASDNHYFTDVIAGAAFGGTTGLLLAR